MQMTRHMHERMNQRAIRSELVALAMDIGEFEGDRYVLTCKTIDTEAAALRQRLKTLEDARKKGGVTVVAGSDCLITAFAANTLNSDRQ